MLSLHKLEVFASVYQVGSFTGAAKQMYITQSAVSQHILDLENTLGTPLFVRGRRGVTPTSAGELLYQYTRQILLLLSEAQSKITDVSALTDGQTVIGATHTISIYLLPQWIRDFRTQYPQLTVSLKTNITSEIIERVLNHTLDIGFIEGELQDSVSSMLGVHQMAEIQLYAVVSKQHELAQHPQVTMAELGAYPFVMRPRDSQTRIWIDQLLARHQLKPSISAEFENPESIKQAVAMSHCVTILPDYALRKEELESRFALLSVSDDRLTRTLKMVWDRQLPLSPIARALLQTLEVSYPALKQLPV